MISFTKSPHTSKKEKKGFFHKVFKKRKVTKRIKAELDNERKMKGRSMEVSPSSLSAEERDRLMKHFTLQLRPNSTSQQRQGSSTMAVSTSSRSATISEVAEKAQMAGGGMYAPSRFSMPVLDDYDSPESPDDQDELLIDSMARV